MAAELGREEVPASDMAAPAANKSITSMLSAFDSSILAANNIDIDLKAASGQERRHLDREGVAAASTGLLDRVSQTPKVSTLVPQGWPAPPRGAQP